MSIIQINESEKNRISDLHKKCQNEVNEKRLTLKEGIQVPNEQPIDEFAGIGTFVKKIFGGLFTGLKSTFKSSDTKVLIFVSDEMSKVVGNLAKSNKTQVSMTAIKNSAGYRKSLSALVEDLSLKKFNLPYERLTKAEKSTVIKEASKGLNDTITVELKNVGKSLAGNIDNLKGAQMVKMGQKTNQITRTIANLDKVKLNKASSLLKDNAKLVGSGKQGATLLNKIKGGKVNVVKNGSVFSATTSSLGNSNVKVFRLTKDQWKKLAKYGIAGAAVLYLIGKMYPDDTVAVITEDGDDGTSTGGGSSTGGRGTFRNCEGNDFPLEFGCKSSKIAEIQKCLGVTDDGKLGPLTLKAMEDNKYDTSRGLSKDVYDAILKACNPETKREKIEPISLAPRKGLNMTDIVAPELKFNDIMRNSENPTNLYKLFVDNGYIKSDTSKTPLEDGTVLPSTRRVKYKGPDLEPQILAKLDEIMSEMGYGRIKQKLDKGYGSKYVWLKN
jgi:hypothetical protein